MWALGTVTVLVLLFSYHTSTSSRFAPTPAAMATRDGDAAELAESGTFDGDAVVTRFGVVQVRITLVDGRIASVQALQVPNRDRHDELINQRAVPVLNAEALRAQSADIDQVSGATLTSQGYAQSLQSAIDKASA